MKDQEWVDKMEAVLQAHIEPLPDGNYYLFDRVPYRSKRYGKWVIAQEGVYDGATGAIDIPSKSWVIHDQVCNDPFFEDGTPISAWMASNIISDILEEEGRWWRNGWWKYATFFFGCKKARTNGWF